MNSVALECGEHRCTQIVIRIILPENSSHETFSKRIDQIRGTVGSQILELAVLFDTSVEPVHMHIYLSIEVKIRLAPRSGQTCLPVTQNFRQQKCCSMAKHNEHHRLVSESLLSQSLITTTWIVEILCITILNVPGNMLMYRRSTLQAKVPCTIDTTPKIIPMFAPRSDRFFEQRQRHKRRWAGDRWQR